MSFTMLVVGVAILLVFAIAIWDLLRPVRNYDDRLRASLGPARGHREARWDARDDGDG